MNLYRILFAAAALVGGIAPGPAQSDEEWQSSQVLEVPPSGGDMFQLNDLASFKKYSRVKNFEIVGHSYLRGPWINPAFANVGMATNTMQLGAPRRTACACWIIMSTVTGSVLGWP